MDFELNDEQKLFSDTVRDWVNNETPKDYAREIERHEGQYPFDLWDKFTDGLTAAVPPACQGANREAAIDDKW